MTGLVPLAWKGHPKEVPRLLAFPSTISALCNGYSKKPDSAWMVNIFHTANTKTHTNVWWEHVDSKANPSDMPSRRDFAFVINELRATYFHPALDEYMWSRPVYQWFY